MTGVERAREALARGDFLAALEVALEAWREHRYEDIGEVITWIGGRLDAPPRDEAPEFHRRWLEVARGARDAATSGWLSATLREGLPDVDALPALGDEPLLARLEALVGTVSDPRVADAALALIAKGRVHDVRIFERCGRLFERHGDHRHARALRQLVLDRRKLRIDRLEADAVHMAAYRLERLARQGASDDSWRALLPPPPPGEDEATRAAAETILEVLHSNPFDVELRSVCVDQLLELGDPLGEFIALQRIERPDAATRRRLRELQSAHQARWLGDDLAQVLVAVRFRDGLPIHATLAATSVAKASVWERALADRRLVTIEVLHRGKAPRWRHEMFRAAIDAFAAAAAAAAAEEEE